MTQCEHEGKVVIKEQRWANCCFARHFKKGDKRNLLGNKAAFDFFEIRGSYVDVHEDSSLLGYDAVYDRVVSLRI